MPKWDTGAATSMFGMFEGCSSLESLPEFNTGNVVRMSWFVSGCEKLTELPAFDTARAEEMSFMFNKCSSLRTIPRLSIAKVADPEKIFLGYPHQQAVAAFFGPFGLRRFRNRLLNILRRFAGKKASRGGKNGGN